MASVRTTTLVVNGAAAEASQVVAVSDSRRKYIGLYSRTGTCKLSFGEGTHTDNYISLAQGNLLELAVNTLDKIEFSTTGAVLQVIQDLDSNVCLTSDSLMMTSDGYPMTYNAKDAGRRLLHTPSFS